MVLVVWFVLIMSRLLWLVSVYCVIMCSLVLMFLWLKLVMLLVMVNLMFCFMLFMLFWMLILMDELGVMNLRVVVVLFVLCCMWYGRCMVRNFVLLFFVCMCLIVSCVRCFVSVEFWLFEMLSMKFLVLVLWR